MRLARPLSTASASRFSVSLFLVAALGLGCDSSLFLKPAPKQPPPLPSEPVQPTTQQAQAPSVPPQVAAPAARHDAASAAEPEDPDAQHDARSSGEVRAEVAESAPQVDLAKEPQASKSAAKDPLTEIYVGTHKLGVNRVTDMARVGTARFTRRGDSIELTGRVARGTHWLELSGSVEPKGASKFVLTGELRGVPNMSWAGEAPFERVTQGRFVFEVRKGRPYFRLYEVNGRECVCNDHCGNDFCYVDIEVAPSK